MNQTPNKPIVRLGEICAWLGVDSQEVDSWVDCGLITVFQKHPRARRFFYPAEIQEKILGQPVRSK